MNDRFNIRPGSRHPAGASVQRDGINFSLFSRHATDVELILYETSTADTPLQVIKLDQHVHRTFFFWHVFVEGLRPGVCYTWRVNGPPGTPETGFRFDPRRELVDPWAKAVNDAKWDRQAAVDPANNGNTAVRGLVVEGRFDWEGDRRLNHDLTNTVIYEMHVGAFTRHPSSGVAHPGTFKGLIEKIDYLSDLGVTDIELLPVMAFDSQDVPPGVATRGLQNFWGYSTHSFYSPHPGYCVTPEQGTHVTEFRQMVKALHRSKIGVILDVVFNHTAEGNEHGPIINFKGIGNEMFYHLDPQNKTHYRDFTGCGNTVNCNHPLVTRFILNCLVYWVKHMHVDGFRFDLASIFARGEDGEPAYNAPLPWMIEFSRNLADTRLIAEAWDAGGLYQVGAFPGYRWTEWNGRYRDVIRRFVRGDKGLVSEMATCIGGSSDLYEEQGRLPINSVNFVTCHDGFTLWDLVSYNRKHNHANGEDNRDGTNDNHSWNCGTEGETSDTRIIALRRRQAKNMMAILFLSQGVPMIYSGDEVLRSQGGNNNAYCQNNDIGWFNWNLVEKNRDMHRFVKAMIAFRKRHPCLRRQRFLTGTTRFSIDLPDIAWHGPRLNQPLWEDPDAQVLVFTMGAAVHGEAHLHVILNMADSPLNAPLPVVPYRHWQRAIDTSRSSPQDILAPHDQPIIDTASYPVQPRSVVVLESRA